MIQHSVWKLGLASLMVFLCLSGTWAQTPAALSDDQVKERLGFLDNVLRSGQPRAKTWWYGWIAGYSAGAAVQGGLAITHWNDTKLDAQSRKVRDRGFAEDMLVGGALAALGAGALLVNPFVPAYGPNKLRHIPEGTPDERLMKLLKAEEILRQCAQREKDGRGWLTHLLNIGANAVAGVVTAAAFHRPWHDGLLTFATGEAVSLLNIFTQPRRAIRDLNNYEVRYLGKQGAYIAGPSERRWEFGLYPGGVCVRLHF